MINKSVIPKSLYDFTKKRQKTCGMVVFNHRLLLKVLKHRKHGQDFPEICKIRFLVFKMLIFKIDQLICMEVQAYSSSKP